MKLHAVGEFSACALDQGALGGGPALDRPAVEVSHL
jgi:hypothetical protein